MLNRNFLNLVLIAILAISLFVVVGCGKKAPNQPEKIEKVDESAKNLARFSTFPQNAKFFYGSDSLVTPDSFQVSLEEKIIGVIKKSGFKNINVSQIGPGWYHYELDSVVVAEPDTTTQDTTTIDSTQYGYLVVNKNETTNGAEVWVSGNLIGYILDDQPSFRDTLEVGFYDLKICRKNYQNFVTTFEILKKQPTTFNPTLVVLSESEPDSTGRLTLLLVRPETASYQVKGPNNGLQTGTLQKNIPVHIENLPAGDYTVSATAEDHLGFLETRKVGPGNWTHDFRIQLDHNCTPTTDSWVNLVVTPENTTINLNDQLWGEGVRWLSIGQHSVTVEKSGWISQTKQFTTVANETTLVKINLVEEEPEPIPECWKTKSDGDYLYFSANVTKLGWEKVKFDASLCNITEVFFSEMQVEGDWYKYYLNNLPCTDYGRFTLVDNPGHWYDKDSDCHPEMISGVAFETNIDYKNWFIFDWNQPTPTTDSWVNLVITPEHTTISLNGQPWGEGISWLNIGNHSVTVEKSGWISQTKQFTTVADETTLVEINLAEEETPANPLKVEASGNVVKLSGDGHENWLGLELYDSDQNETTGWIVNHWVKGTDKGNYTEFVIPDARLSHGVFWKDATPGLEGSGGSGTQPRFAYWDQLQKGSGISQINTNPGYFVKNP